MIKGIVAGLLFAAVSVLTIGQLRDARPGNLARLSLLALLLASAFLMSKFITRHAGAAKSAAVTLIAASVIGVSFEMWSRPLINRFGVPSALIHRRIGVRDAPG